jgi:hypothetical protein
MDFRFSGLHFELLAAPVARDDYQYGIVFR